MAKLTKFQTVEAPMPTIEMPQPVTELLQIRTNRSLTTANSLQRDSSVSTPTPSTTPEINNMQGTIESVQNEQQEMVRLLKTVV